MESLDDLDLNLLRTLDVLLTERSVTNAARVLGRSQPAVSHALRRLRDALDDPLLVRQGRGLVPTPRAEALAAPVHRILDDLHRTLTARPGFDPATTRRRFLLAAPPLLAPLLPDLLRALADAPSLGLELVSSRKPGAMERADVVLDRLPEEAPGVVARPLGRVAQAVLHRTDHPLLGADWGLEAWLAWPHVLVRTDDGSPSLVDRVLAAEGLERTVGLVVDDLLLVPHVVRRTDLLFTGPRQVLQPLCEPLQLTLRPTPVPIPEVPVAAMWQQRLHADPGHRWFRDRVVGVFTPHLAHAVDGRAGYL